MIDTKLLRSGFGRGSVPATEGARTSVYLATAVNTVTGQYFIDSQPTQPSTAARDEAVGRGALAGVDGGVATLPGKLR